MIKATENKTGETNFPKLMRCKLEGYIVLFKTSKTGTIVADKDINCIGDHSHQWDMDDFEDYKGEITLTNI